MAKRPAPRWNELRAALWERCRGRCEVTGLPLDPETFDSHHRRPKGMGGTYRPDTDTLPNLLALDPQVHNGGPRSVHGDRRTSEEFGWLLPLDRGDPRIWPVLIRRTWWVLLTPEGGYLHITNPPA